MKNFKWRGNLLGCVGGSSLILVNTENIESEHWSVSSIHDNSYLAAACVLVLFVGCSSF